MSECERKEIVDSLKFVWMTFYQDDFSFNEITTKIKKGVHLDHLLIIDSEDHARPEAKVLIAPSKCISSTIIRQRVYESFNNSKR